MYSYETSIVGNAGKIESPVLVLRLVNTAGKVVPPFADVLYKISSYPGVSSSHTT